MKSAKEMFEELGYNEFYKHKTYMFYVKPLKENPNYEKDYIHLEFDFKNKTFVKTYGDDNSVYEITLEELQAINKQVEELKWKVDQEGNMKVEEMIEYLKHHIPIIIKDDKCWCNAKIKFENGTLVVVPDYNMPFDN